MTLAIARPAVPSVGVHRTPNHQYYFDGRGPWPGVTTIVKVLESPALTNWKREQVARAAVRHATRLVDDASAGNEDAAVAFLLRTRTPGDDARDRGTRIHTALQGILERTTPRVEVRDVPAVRGARAWLNEHKVVPIEIEAFLLNETLGYGGTCDLVAWIGGEVWLLDWKTSGSVADRSGRVYDDMRLQLAAYSHAEFVAKPADSTRYPMPAITRYGILHVTDAGTRLYAADVTDADWTAFRACLWLHGWKSGSR
jgi:hypothetical protein